MSWCSVDGMLRNPRQGQRVQRHDAKHDRGLMPYHGRPATVLVAGTCRPRNHLVVLEDGIRVVVPAGNLQALQAGETVAVQGVLAL